MVWPGLSTAREIAPLPLDLNIRLVHAPAHPHRPLAGVERLCEQGTVFDHPALNGRVIY